MNAKELSQVMEMLKDMQTIKQCLVKYAGGLEDSGSLARVTLERVRPDFAHLVNQEATSPYLHA